MVCGTILGLPVPNKFLASFIEFFLLSEIHGQYAEHVYRSLDSEFIFKGNVLLGNIILILAISLDLFK